MLSTKPPALTPRHQHRHHDDKKTFSPAQAGRRAGTPEGVPILAADGLNDCVEGTLDSGDEGLEEGGNELEHNVLLTIGKRRTRGWLVRL